MAASRPLVPVLLVVAAFSRHDDALAWGRRALEQAYGPLDLAGPLFAFSQTAYYERSMGAGLQKQLWAFRHLVQPDSLADIKRHTIALEEQCRLSGSWPEQRPLNLDPGYLVLGKFILATTKDQAHRVYLRDGIFAEVTLHYQSGCYRPWPWTYADYRLPEVIAFLEQARAYYRDRLAELAPTAETAVPPEPDDQPLDGPLS